MMSHCRARTETAGWDFCTHSMVVKYPLSRGQNISVSIIEYAREKAHTYIIIITVFSLAGSH